MPRATPVRAHRRAHTGPPRENRTREVPLSAGPGTPSPVAGHTAAATATLAPDPRRALRDFVTAVEGALVEFFDTRKALVEPLGPPFVESADVLREFVLRGGKRTRPSFAWTGWLGAGGDPDGPDAPRVLRACAALELVQACALIHDDIIDSSRTRRRFPTVHVDFEQRHRERALPGDAAHFGVSVAILVGDLALAWADDMVNGAGLDPAALARFATVWAHMRTEVLGGQLLDIQGEAGGDETVAAALRICEFKTAAYTIERPLHLGAALADAGPELVAAYRTFGKDIGVAFQLRDDLLGVFGDPEVTGKPSGDDLREGKRTVLLAEALRRADAADPAAARLLRSRIGTDLGADEVAHLRELLVDLGAVDDVETRITDLTERGLAALESSSAEPVAKAQLRAMALAATRRAL
ncbi:polyprenyl synthetase family protein [Nocardia sp. NPDC057353]|uniref:polyprenyl synthetase family protein n=1 Tax=Nocardia sp. NPDC057353 TaxID=3346104 RepID=UPI003624ECA5